MMHIESLGRPCCSIYTLTIYPTTIQIVLCHVTPRYFRILLMFSISAVSTILAGMHLCSYVDPGGDFDIMWLRTILPEREAARATAQAAPKIVCCIRRLSVCYSERGRPNRNEWWR